MLSISLVFCNLHISSRTSSSGYLPSFQVPFVTFSFSCRERLIRRRPCFYLVRKRLHRAQLQFQHRVRRQWRCYQAQRQAPPQLQHRGKHLFRRNRVSYYFVSLFRPSCFHFSLYTLFVFVFCIKSCHINKF